MEVLIAIAVGLTGGAIAGYLGARSVVRYFIERARHRGVVIGFAAVAMLAMIPVAFFLSFVVGGNFGGALGAGLSESVNRGAAGAPFGLAVGIAIVLAIGLIFGASVGARIGYWVSRAIQRKLAA
jgi:hypothetical protein